jgi:maleate cis-trans isomerase
MVVECSMYGDRARIGLIVPSSNTVCEPEMATLCPEGVVTYSTRVLFQPTLKGLGRMKNYVGKAALELSSEGICKIIAFCCTVGSVMGGIDLEREIINLIEKRANTPAITTATAVKASFDALKVNKIAIATPYYKATNQREKEGFERQGYHVTKIMGYHESAPPRSFKNEMIGRLLPEVAYKMGLEVNGKENEAIFISCTNFRTIEIIQKLEKETGKPVISSNQATMWYALRRLGLKDSIKGYGQLLGKY